MPGWAIGLATRASAWRAARWGGGVCLVLGTILLVATLYAGATSSKPVDHAIAWTVGASSVPLLICFGGFRLVRGRGRISGSLAAAILLIDTIMTNANSPKPALVIAITLTLRAILILIVVNGVRGAFALPYFDTWEGQELGDTFS